MTGASARRPHAPLTAADSMRPALSTVKPDDHVAGAAYVMKHPGARALVVVGDEQARWPLGLITGADIVRAVAGRRAGFYAGPGCSFSAGVAALVLGIGWVVRANVG